MPNPLLPYFNTTHSLTIYQTIKQQLGWEELIFLAMNQVAQKRGFKFELPTTSAEYNDKHSEVEQTLRHEVLLNRRGVFFDLVEELHIKLLSLGRMVTAERLRNMTVLETDLGFTVRLNADGAWTNEWPLSVNVNGITTSTVVYAVVYERNQEQIVPWTVIEYIHSGIMLYKKGVYTTALALMTVAVETTLRDLLSTRGYGFHTGSSKVDIYEYSDAKLDVDGTSYRLTFPNAMPKSPTMLSSSYTGNLPIDIRLRRVINEPKNRVDLLMSVPNYLADYLSSDHVVQPGRPKMIGGLGTALSVARDTEKIISAVDLPPDLDEVLRAVRNNFIHLSSNSMSVELSPYASLSHTGIFTLADFVSRPEMVFAFVTDVPKFVNEQYVKLWKASGNT